MTMVHDARAGSQEEHATSVFVHPRALCETDNVGHGTRIWAFAYVLPGARIGSDCNNVFIENDVLVGSRVTVKCGVQLWDGVTLEDDVFVGPNATFTNDVFPRSKDVPSAEVRGEHAHRSCHQFFVCPRGEVSIVADDGTNREEFVLDAPTKGIYLPPMVWGIQYRYSGDAILLAFASHHYDVADYIRDYEQFLMEVGCRSR